MKMQLCWPWPVEKTKEQARRPWCKAHRRNYHPFYPHKIRHLTESVKKPALLILPYPKMAKVRGDNISRKCIMRQPIWFGSWQRKLRWYEKAQAEYDSVALTKCKGRWWLVYEGKRRSGGFETKAKAIAWYRNAGR